MSMKQSKTYSCRLDDSESKTLEELAKAANVTVSRFIHDTLTSIIDNKKLITSLRREVSSCEQRIEEAKGEGAAEFLRVAKAKQPEQINKILNECGKTELVVSLLANTNPIDIAVAYYAAPSNWKSRFDGKIQDLAGYGDY